MKASIELLVRGLLVLALGGYAIGCGDDSGDKKTDSGMEDAGPVGGTGGTTPMVDGGTGGAPAGMCIADTTKLVGTKTPAACVSCACTKDAKATLACDAMCWGLIDCVVQKCAGLDMTGTTACATTMCMTFIGGAATATALGTVLTTMCATECATSPTFGDDGGVDAGN